MKTDPWPSIPAYVQDDDNDPWWDSIDAQCLLQDLCDVLDSYAPTGRYFGTHPGDGSDFGFWQFDLEEDY